MAASASRTVDTLEVARFDALAAGWWDPEGTARPLHAMNPVRLGYIRDRVVARHGRPVSGTAPLAGLSAVDVGCGGGILSEPLARMGAAVTGIDAAPEGIEVARRHAAEAGLAIDYRVETAEGLAATGARFDLVCALEIVEHVADVDAFCAALAALLAPGGTLVMSTLNRTPQSWVMAILGAEHLLRVIPRGTHDWKKFLSPAELAAHLRRQGLRVDDLSGMVPDPGGETGWRLSKRRLGVNYILAASVA
jgi:2-polyprenyl-6-hydroxyphenyl methylase/3-demethylubiquinone-9 3-methyltransferase